MATSPNLNPRQKRIPPRAEELIRYINDTIVRDLKADSSGDVVFTLPDTISLAFKVVNETGTITVIDYGLDVGFVQRQ